MDPGLLLLPLVAAPLVGVERRQRLAVVDVLELLPEGGGGISIDNIDIDIDIGNMDNIDIVAYLE